MAVVAVGWGDTLVEPPARLLSLLTGAIRLSLDDIQVYSLLRQTERQRESLSERASRDDEEFSRRVHGVSLYNTLRSDNCLLRIPAKCCYGNDGVTGSTRQQNNKKSRAFMQLVAAQLSKIYKTLNKPAATYSTCIVSTF